MSIVVRYNPMAAEMAIGDTRRRSSRRYMEWECLPTRIPLFEGSGQLQEALILLRTMTREEMLATWTTDLRCLQQEHALASRFYEKLNWRLGMPAVVFSAAAGAAIFSSDPAGDFPYARVAAGILTLLAAIASAAQTFLDCAQRSMDHKLAAAKFGGLVAQSELACVQKMDEATFDKLLADIRTKWNSAQADAPNLRESFIKRSSSRFDVPTK